MRDEKGRFPPGVSGNPKGRSKEEYEIAQAAREYTEEALKTLAAAMRSADKWADRVAACRVLLDRGWGTAPQSIKVESTEGIYIGIDAPRSMTEAEWLERRKLDLLAKSVPQTNGTNGTHR